MAILLTLTLLSLFGEIARIGQTCSIQRVKEIFLFAIHVNTSYNAKISENSNW